VIIPKKCENLILAFSRKYVFLQGAEHHLEIYFHYMVKHKMIFALWHCNKYADVKCVRADVKSDSDNQLVLRLSLKSIAKNFLLNKTNAV